MTVEELTKLLDLIPDDGGWQSIGIKTIIQRLNRGGYIIIGLVDTGGPKVGLRITHTITGDVINVKADTVEGAFRQAIERALAHHADRARGSALHT